tara:strand:+ start:18692 stop:18913 length:222 start_codon:yes stop_codon:yes gene_type:complete
MANKKTNTHTWVTSIGSFHAIDNEVWLGCTKVNEKTGELEDHTIVLTIMDVLGCGLTDKKHLKKQLTKYINKI